MNKLQKFSSAVMVSVILVAGAVNVFAQETTETEAPSAICTPAERPEGAERPDRDAILLEAGISQEEIDAAKEAGTLDDLVEAHEEAIEAVREAHQAEHEAEKLAALNTCLEEALASGALTAEQVAEIQAAAEAGTLRELLHSEAYADIHLFPPRHEGRDGERGERGGRDGEGRRGGEGRPPRGGQGGEQGQPPVDNSNNG